MIVTTMATLEVVESGLVTDVIQRKGYWNWMQHLRKEEAKMLQGAWLEQQGRWWCHLPGWIKGKDRRRERQVG